VASVTYTGTGRRKTSVARVILTPGVGRVVVNGKELDDYFGRRVLQTIAVMPFEATHTQAKFDVRVNVNGGGMAGQAGAIRHGIARALIVADENLRTPLKRAGFLTRDARAVERKKAGLKKARKRPQFSKR
jgi:small subunit ribosomal protein S9